MNAKNYFDWWRYSGLCVGKPFHPDAFDTLSQALSRSGVVTIIVGDLLQRNPDDLGDQRYELELTEFQEDRDKVAHVCAEIGAIKLAALFNTPVEPPPNPEDVLSGTVGYLKFMLALAKSASSRPDVESHHEVRALLKDFVAKHSKELLEDVERHGDRRKSPGFKRALAEREREKREIRASERVYIDRLLDRLETRLKEFHRARETHPATSTKTAKLAARLQGEVEKYESYDRANLSARAQQWLADCDAALRSYKATARSASDKTSAPHAILVPEALAELGPYEVVHAASGRSYLTWKSPSLLASDMAPIDLLLRNDQVASPQAVVAVESLRRRIGDWISDIRRQLIATARESDAVPQELTDDEILSMVTGGTISLSDWGRWHLELGVDWEEEHGFEMDIIERV